MAPLRATLEQFIARANEYRVLAIEIDDVLSRLDVLINSFGCEFTRNDLFKYGDLRQSFVSMRRLIINLAAELEMLATDWYDT